MSSSQNLDIRAPIGGLFTVLGLMLAGYGMFATGSGGPADRTSGLNVNLWWGLTMLAFGLVLLLMARRAAAHPQPPPPPHPTPIPIPRSDQSMPTRREFVQNGVVLGAIGGLGAAVSACAANGAIGGSGGGAAASQVSAATPAGNPAGSLKQSVCRWCFNDMPLDELAANAKRIGLQSVELLQPAEFPTVVKHGLTCAMVSAPPPAGIPRGFNRVDNHSWLIPLYEERIAQVAQAKLPNQICFSGNRGGISDDEGLQNCAKGLRALMPVAERHGVTLCMELLNSKVNHADYQCDHTAWGVKLVQAVGSERFKLLYDIYHMQVMEGDVIRTIKDNHRAIGHYHTAGVPGRHEIDDSQELFYPAIMRAIKETGYTGFVGQEFTPQKKDGMASLADAVRRCAV